MKKIKLSILIASFIFLGVSSCMIPQPKPLTNQTKKIGISIASVDSPKDEGWYIMQKNKYRMTIIKEGKLVGESFVVAVGAFPLPEISSDKEFIDYISDIRKKEANSTGRFESISNKEIIEKLNNTRCVYFHSISQDKNPKVKSQRKEKMLMNLVGYHCQHPSDNTIGIYSEYSRRAYESDELPNFEFIAKSILNTLVFEDLKL